jgi:NADPH:quinone reductase-like Zn-dependent oxidoreductase
MTGGQPIDVIVDTVSGPMLPSLIEILRPQGRYATCGAMGGPTVQIDMRRIYLKNLEIYGASQGTRRDFRAVRDFAISGAIKPLLANKYSLPDLGRAQEEFKKKSFVGKLVVEVG